MRLVCSAYKMNLIFERMIMRDLIHHSEESSNSENSIHFQFLN